MAKKLARVLAAFHDGDLQLAPNDLVSGEAAVIAAHEKAGLVDSAKGAVSYCESEGKKAIAIIGDGVEIDKNAEKSEAEKAEAEKAEAEKAEAEKADAEKAEAEKAEAEKANK